MHPIYKYNLNVSYVSFVQTTISVIILIKIKLKFLFHFINKYFQTRSTSFTWKQLRFPRRVYTTIQI